MMDVHCRKSLSRVRQEILGMDVRIGVLEHTVMQARLRDRSNMQRDYHNEVNQQKMFYQNF